MMGDAGLHRLSIYILQLLLFMEAACLAQKVPLEGCRAIEIGHNYEAVAVEFTSTSRDEAATTSLYEGFTHSNNTAEKAITGVLIEPMHIPTGCTENSYGQVPQENWVAFVLRGNCSYSTKASVAISLGAEAMLLYQKEEREKPIIMSKIPYNFTAASLSHTVGELFSKKLEQDVIISVTIDKPSGDGGNTLVIVLASVMCPVAIFLNAGALLAIICYPEKPKPHLYLIGNLIVTDLLVSILATVIICLLYPVFTSKPTEFTEVTTTCIASLLNEVWDLAMFSNLFTLLGLTAEHFIAFRWPIKHKIMVTKQRVLGIICLSWILSAIPMVAGMIKESLLDNIPNCVEETFCRRSYYYTNKNSQASWTRAVPCVLFVSLVITAMIGVYGYVMVIIHRVSQRNPGFRKKGTAMITTSCLIVSFLLSYAYYITDNFSRVVRQEAPTPLQIQIHAYFIKVCPACRLIMDFFVTGLIGAIMDPIIYCVRMKEVKLACSKVCKGGWMVRHVSVTSGGGYTRAGQNSVTVDENL